MDMYPIIHTGVLIGLTIAWMLVVRIAKKASYYRGRHDELRSIDLAESYEAYNQITSHQIGEYLGAKERRRWEETMAEGMAGSVTDGTRHGR